MNMKTETVNAKSWHYRLATTYGNASKYRLEVGEANFCSYFWSCVFGMFLVFSVIIFSSLFSIFLVLMPGVYIASTILELGFHFPADWFVVAGFVFDAILFMFVAACVAQEKGYIAKMAESYAKLKPNTPPKPPGFMKLAYRKFKEKTCFRLQSVE